MNSSSTLQNSQHKFQWHELVSLQETEIILLSLYTILLLSAAFLNGGTESSKFLFKIVTGKSIKNCLNMFGSSDTVI